MKDKSTEHIKFLSAFYKSHFNKTNHKTLKNNISEEALIEFNEFILKNYYSRKNITELVMRLNSLLLHYAKHKFSEQAEKTGDDMLDSLITAINFLGEELNFSTVTTHYTQDIFNSIGDMLLVVDKKGYMLFANQAATKILGYKAKELKKNSIDLILEDNIDFESLLNLQKKKKNLINFITRNGERLPVFLKISDFIRGDNPMMGHVIIARDMGMILKHQAEIEGKNKRIMATNKELNKALLKAEQADKLKSAFLANISHEIRTPLNGIMGFAQLLDDNNTKPENYREFGHLIHKAGLQLLNIVNDVLDISKIESGTLKLNDNVFCLNTMLDELHGIYKQKAQSLSKEIKLELIKSMNDTESFMKCDEVRLKQVLYNLLDNAVKFTKEGFITFGYSQSSNKIIFFVKDTGIGIPKSKIGTIFKPFMQSDTSLTRTYGGAGLGLSIAEGIVNLFRGKIWVDTFENKGSCFYFEIPFCKASNDKENFKNKELYYNWKNKHIIIVEDDVISAKLYKYYLENTNANLVFFENGKDVINYIKKNNMKADLILLDIKLPDIDGINAAEIIRTYSKKINIIAQSAHISVEDKKRCLDAGCNSFIPKPVNPKLLLSQIDKLFNEENIN